MTDMGMMGAMAIEGARCRVEECRLKAANGLRGVPCSGPSCILWRVVGQLDLIEGADEDGCAVERFALLESHDRSLASWLLSVKESTVSEEIALEPPLLPVSTPHLPN